MRILYDSEYSDEPTHQALFRLLVMRVGAAVPRGPTACAVPPGTDVPACADHIAEELVAISCECNEQFSCFPRNNLAMEHMRNNLAVSKANYLAQKQAITCTSPTVLPTAEL